VKKVYYHLQQVSGPSKGDWSAEQSLVEQADPLVCPVKAWKNYMERTSDKRLEGKSPDRLFLEWEPENPEGSADSFSNALSDVKICALIENFLRSAGLDQKIIKDVMTEQAQVHTIQDVQIAMLDTLLASRYNKAQAIDLFARHNNLKPSCIVFVDDNVDNAFNVFLHYAQNQLKESTTSESAPTVISFWYQPPKTGREEACQELYKSLFTALSKI